MGICVQELRLCVVRPTLKHLNCYNSFTENLLLGTAAVESELGTHIKESKQSAIGLYKITPYLHRMIWDQYLAQFPDLASKIRGLASQHEFLARPHQELATNLSYATAIACSAYWRADCMLVGDSQDVQKMADYWHQYYHAGRKVTPDDYINAYQQQVGSTLPV